MAHALARRLDLIAVAALIAATTTLFAHQSLSRYFTFHHRTFDLALYARRAWGLAHGDFWNPVLDQSFFASHWSWVLAPLGLLGRAIGTAEVLLIAQAFAMCLAAWPLAAMARRRHRALGPLAAAAFLLYPNMAHVAAYEFHPGNLALPGLSFALDALDRGDAKRLVLSCLWVLLCRADFAIATAVLGLLAWHAGVRHAGVRHAGAEPLRQTGVRLVVASVGYLALVQTTRALFVDALPSADLHFGPWGGSPLGLLPALFQRPTVVWEHFVASERLSYPLRVLLPLAFLPLLRPRYALVGLPFLLLNLASVFPTSTELYSHYLTPALPALVGAAIEGLACLRGRVALGGLCAMAIATIATHWHHGGAPWSRDHPARAFAATGQSWSASWALSAIPPDVSVQAPDPLLPHLAEREVVHRAPPPERGTEVVVLDARHRLRFFGQETLLRTTEEPSVRAWLAREDYAVVEATPAFIVMVRDVEPRAAFARRYFAPALDRARPLAQLCGCLELLGASLRPDHHLALSVRVRQRCPSDLALRIGATPRPDHVRLLFDGYFSPTHLRAGDVIDLDYRLPPPLSSAIVAAGVLHVGALRTSGAPPESGDPIAVALPLSGPVAGAAQRATRPPQASVSAAAD